MHQQNKKPQKSQAGDNLIEQLRDVGKGVAKTVKTDLIGGFTQDALSSLFGTPKSGEMQPGEAVDFNEQPPLEPSPWENLPFPYAQRREQFHAQYSQEVINRLKQQETEVLKKIEEIRLELKALIAQLKVVNQEIMKTVDTQTVEPGLYHLTFLDRIKTILKLIRQNLQDSNSWLSVMRSRKKHRTYWAMYKKKGTEFGLNSERVVATQVG